MAASSSRNSTPPYPDIWLKDNKITDEIKYDVLTKSWNTVHSYEFPTW